MLVAALVVLMRGTRLGLAIRAMAERPDAAAADGHRHARTAATVSFLSGALAGAGGVLIGLNFNAIHPYMGEDDDAARLRRHHRRRPGRHHAAR